MAGTVVLAVAEGVATLTLNRPQALNALSVEMMEDLAEATRALAGRSDFAVLVIKGAGEHFMAGGDLKDFACQLTLSPEARLAAFQAMIVQHINPTVEVLQSLSQPVIACVRGACAGFGLSLMAACDLVVAADNAKFTTAYATIALSGDGGASYFLPRIVGARKAAELLLLAERFDALVAVDEAAVRAFHAAGLAAGGSDEGGPGYRPYGPSFYTCYLRDPDGNKISAVCERAARVEG